MILCYQLGYALEQANRVLKKKKILSWLGLIQPGIWFKRQTNSSIWVCSCIFFTEQELKLEQLLNSCNSCNQRKQDAKGRNDSQIKYFVLVILMPFYKITLRVLSLNYNFSRGWSTSIVPMNLTAQVSPGAKGGKLWISHWRFILCSPHCRQSLASH